MVEVTQDRRVGAADQALVNQTPAGLGRSGFDPSRELANIRDSLLAKVPVPGDGSWAEFLVRKTTKRFAVDWCLYDLWEGEPFLWAMGTVSTHGTEAKAAEKAEVMRAVLRMRDGYREPAQGIEARDHGGSAQTAPDGAA